MDRTTNLAIAAAAGAVAFFFASPLIAVGAFGVTAAVLFSLGKSGKKRAPVALDPTKKIPFPLIKKENISHDTRRFTFELQSPEHILGLPVGKHMYLSARVNGKLVPRAYTPVSSDDDKGVFVLVVKIYYPNERFPEGGKLTQYLDQMKIGDTIDVRGPNGEIEYLGRGLFQHSPKNEPVEKRQCKHIGMIAGGTGITPMLQIVSAILKDPEDKTTMSLIFANQTEEDILVRDELEKCAKDDRFSLWYTLDRPGDNWNYSKGFITDTMISDHLPPAGPDTQLLVCGPPPMVKFACLPNFEKLGYDKSMYMIF
eukprot:m.13065 g.13065  ORF g.13065 m.13065 type:complete len:312 (+) comp8273_c0_seq1:136-1071(+)